MAAVGMCDLVLGTEHWTIDGTGTSYAASNRHFYHPYLLTRMEPKRDMDPNTCALESTGLELSNARGFKSNFFTVAIIS